MRTGFWGDVEMGISGIWLGKGVHASVIIASISLPVFCSGLVLWLVSSISDLFGLYLAGALSVSWCYAFPDAMLFSMYSFSPTLCTWLSLDDALFRKSFL